MINEFIFRINQIYGTFINLNLAFALFSSRIEEMLPDDSKNIHFGDGDPNDPNTKFKLSINIEEFKNQINEDGHDIKLISNLCLAAKYQLWEDEYREKIANSIGKMKNEIKSDVIGDIRIIRQAIIHYRSMRFKDFEKIKILLFFKDRENIFITKSEFDITVELLKNELQILNRSIASIE